MSSPAVQLRSRFTSKSPRGIAEAAVARARLTVVPRRRTRAARMPFVVLVSLVLLGGVIGLLLFNTSMQQASFAATALEQQASAMTAREQTLKMELDVLRDPQRVAEQAQNMGMVPPGSPTFLNLANGKVLGDRAPATSMNAVRLLPLPPVKPAILDPPPLPARPETSSETTAGSGRDGQRAGARDRNDRADRDQR